MESRGELFRKINTIRTIFEENIRKDKPIFKKDIIKFEETYKKIQSLSNSYPSKEIYLNQANINFYKSYMHLYERNFIYSMKEMFSYISNLSNRYILDPQYKIHNSLSKIQPYTIKFSELKGSENYFDLKFLKDIKDIYDTIISFKLSKEIFNQPLAYIIRPVLIDIKNNISSYHEEVKKANVEIDELLISSKRNHLGKEKHLITSLINSIKYKINKFFMFHLLKIRCLKTLPEISEIMKKSSYDAFVSYKKFYNQVPKGDINALLGMEIDKEFANYYYYNYHTLKPIKAINSMKNIESRLIISKFETNKERSLQINYFERELNHFILFFKLLLLKKDINKKITILNETWEKEMYEIIIENIDNSLSQFKRRNEFNTTDYDLKIISSNFSGIITELFIYRIITEVKNNPSGKATNPQIQDLIDEIQITEIENIKMREVLKEKDDETDADIMLINESHISCITIKNRPLGSCFKEIKHEFELFKAKSVNKVYILSNLLKTNLNDYNKLNEFLVVNFPHIEIHFMDIRELTNVLLTTNKQMKHLLMFNFELYSIFDY